MVRQDDHAAKLFVEKRLKVAICDPFIGLLIEHNQQIVGAVILNDYTPGRNIEATVVAVGPWSPTDYREMVRYCFDRVRRITARTSVHNTPAIKRLTAMGFRREGVLREWFEDGDAILFSLLRSEQRICRAR